MKLLWSGEEVTYRGRYFRATGAQVGITPVQTPHPPIWLACQGPRAAARAARIADACLVGPYVSWADHQTLAKIYWDELEQTGSSADGFYAGHRCISVAADRETAIKQARETAENTAKLYGGWGMQEKLAVDLGLDKLRNLEEWAVVGNPQQWRRIHRRAAGQLPVGLYGLHLPQPPRRTPRPTRISPARMGRRLHPRGLGNPTWAPPLPHDMAALAANV